ncbi:MAG: hypothetical protein PHR60_01200 [Eubacteriales bacterium]|nr:hypothetical protein [Eubacteriales bacterium]
MKKIISQFIVTIMLVMMVTGTAFAGNVDFTPIEIEQVQTTVAGDQLDQSSNAIKIQNIAEKVNQDIASEIAKAQIKAEKAKDEADLDGIIIKLLDKTAKLVDKGIIKIERLGGEAVCEYITVEIGDRTILVDPIRIVRL